LVLCCAAGLLIAGPGRAQEREATVVLLPAFNVEGRQDSLLGTADSASQGTVGADELAERPILRTGELLETIPGVIITQHAGGGKANQYFTRGFNLDHGTDFSVSLDDMPVNLPSHAHGQGYADLNIVIPEFIDRIDFQKGPYYAANGDFSTVGSAQMVFVQSLPSDFLQVEGGTDGYARAVVGISTPAAGGTLLAGFEAAHEDGPWVRPDDYWRYNGMLRYSQGTSQQGYSVTAMAYHGTWNSTDQVAASAVSDRQISYFGTQNPADGGYSQRYSLQGEWHQNSQDEQTSVMAYVFHYDLNLFSDFTYYLDSPMGDQFEQQDNRNVAGIRASHAILASVGNLKIQNRFGVQAQDSWIDLGLYQTVDRVRTDKVDYSGNPISAVTRLDHVNELSSGFFYDNEIAWTPWLRSDLGLREDLYRDGVQAQLPVNSGVRTGALASPKATLTFGPWNGTEFYVQAGYGFHSNDARATTASLNPDGTLVGGRLPVLVPAHGGEIGVRSLIVPQLQSTLSLWGLHNNSELYFDGLDADSGDASTSQQATRRYGVEFSNFYTPAPWVTFDLDFADSSAHFTAPTTAAEDLTPGGTLVDEAIHTSLSSGITFRRGKDWDASLRLRYFGPRPLTSDGSVTSHSTTIVNLGSSWQLTRRWKVRAEVLNLLDRRDHDIDYYYTSRNSPAPGSPTLTEDHFHPVEPIEFRFGLEAKL
jgi:outer membrane receptor protein involved in Fe transport